MPPAVPSNGSDDNAVPATGPTGAMPARNATAGWLPGGWLAAGGILVGFALCAALVRVGLQQQWPLPFCLLRRFTGLPCPGCGATRSLSAWAHLDPLTALQFNPLFFVATLAALGWALAGLLDATRSTRWQQRIHEALSLHLTTRRAVGLLAANWVYLCFFLPR